ncbi:hypothetical protein [uncultured Duncaniella sp.]|uniref:hypothetical protein n=1 Tax=uncultured Duncaniella sp. TaxID=2768039 RepID=UPI00264886F6|nr:hypothetical protein [uncultured Duncaniella sp.]
MQKAIDRLHRQLLAEENQCPGSTRGALVIVGTASDSNHGNVTSFSGGDLTPITMGLVNEMRRDPGILASVRMALSIVENQLAEQN